MNRWLILILFVLSLVSGYFAFIDSETNRLWTLDAIFLVAVILFLMGFVTVVGRALRANLDDEGGDDDSRDFRMIHAREHASSANHHERSGSHTSNRRFYDSA